MRILIKNISESFSALSAIPNRGNINILFFDKVIDFISQYYQIAICSDFGKLFILPTQIGHGMKVTNSLYNLSSPTFCHLWTCKLAVKMKNVIKFV